LTAVLFADLSGFGALTDALGDEVAADVATRFAALARHSLVGGARLLKTLGDGALVVAPDADAARATAQRLRDLVRQEQSLLPVRVGMCEGDVVWRGDDVFGATVNRAARLADEAEPWEISESALPDATAAVA
jgi:adenylate cyclase